MKQGRLPIIIYTFIKPHNQILALFVLTESVFPSFPLVILQLTKYDAFASTWSPTCAYKKLCVHILSKPPKDRNISFTN